MSVGSGFVRFGVIGKYSCVLIVWLLCVGMMYVFIECIGVGVMLRIGVFFLYVVCVCCGV